MSVNECRLEKNPLKDHDKVNYPKAMVTTSLPLNIVIELEAISRDHNLRLTPLFHSLALRGLAAYYRDGLLEEPADTSHIEE